MSEIKKTTWEGIEKEEMSAMLTRRMVSGERGTLAQLSIKCGGERSAIPTTTRSIV